MKAGKTIREVLEVLDLAPCEVTTLKDGGAGNSSWLVEPSGGERFVLRRYHDRATADELAYEHTVLHHLAAAGWVVPHPVGEAVEHAGRWYCPTRFVAGEAVRDESPDQRRRRGRDLALLDIALRDLGGRIGQRPRWRPQHAAVTAHADIDWDAGLRRFAKISPRLAHWAADAAARSAAELASLGAGDLEVTVIHGDFAEWNVHYQNGELAGVVDFGLTHVDSRPYELAIARTWRSPETIDAYRETLAREGWALTELEEAAIGPINRAW